MTHKQGSELAPIKLFMTAKVKVITSWLCDLLGSMIATVVALPLFNHLPLLSEASHSHIASACQSIQSRPISHSGIS